MNESNPASSPSERELFFEALGKTSKEERSIFLDGACFNQPELRRRIEELLASHARQDSFLEEPAVEGITTLQGTPLSEGPGTVVGRYKLLQKVGEGGMGVVYMAEQTEPVTRKVALKIIKLGMDTKQVIARFEAERQALAMMNHPNIAKVLDAGATDTGRPYFVMELVRGVPITEYCDKNKLSTQERLNLFIPVCNAIQHAHQKGIIHRDIKPSNVMVTLNDGVPHPMVIDFGIAKATNQKLTEKTLFTNYAQMIGTPAYMSPEQAEMSKLDVDTRTDVYSLGVLLYELLTGTTPFPSKELLSMGYGEMQKVIAEREPPKPSTRMSTMENETRTVVAKNRSMEVSALGKLFQGDLDWIVMKALEKDRTHRYETVNGLAADIKRHLNNEPVSAAAPTFRYQLQKFARRNKRYVRVAAAVAGMLVLATGFATFQAVRATRAERAQTKQREIALKALDGEKEQHAKAEAEQQRADTALRLATKSQRQSRRQLYAADMSLAQQSLKMNNLGRARRLLERHRPQLGEEDLRGWEWRYLWQLTRSSALTTLTNRPTRGGSVSFSPDGTRLAVGWWNGQVDLWDVAGRRLIRSLTVPASENSGRARAVFSPVSNLLAATLGVNVVSLYDMDSGRESILWQRPDKSRWIINDLAFSQDGSKVVFTAGTAFGSSGFAWVVDVSTGKIEQPIPSWLDQFSLATRLSPDNRRLYLAARDSASRPPGIQCIDLTTGREIWPSIPLPDAQPESALTALAVSPDGHSIASSSGFEDTDIHIWDAETGGHSRKLEGHSAYVMELVFSRDGRALISAGSDQTIRFWDTKTWTETRVLRGNTDEVQGVAISDTAGLVASASKSGDLMLWKTDREAAAETYVPLEGDLQSDDVLGVDGSRVLALSDEGQPPRLIDLKQNAPAMSLPELGSSSNFLGRFGTNVFCRWDGTNQILLSQWSGSKFVPQGAVAVDSGARPTGVAYHAGRRLLAWAAGTNSSLVYLVNLMAPDRRIGLKSDILGLSPLRFSPDGNYLAANNPSQDALLVWNVETGGRVVSIHTESSLVRFAGASTLVVARGGRGDIHDVTFYDLLHTNREPRRFNGRIFPSALKISPDGRLVVMATGGGQIRWFDPVEAVEIESVRGHINAAAGIAFSPDGRRVISTAIGREAVKVWDAGTRQELLTLEGRGSYLNKAGWSLDGDVIITGPPWQSWRAPSFEEIATAEAKEIAESNLR
ncbi:MAG: protein kinase [Verrucomicrobia bacterium]|nr:protein kinase [Verrucomicrobiota bacterium]